MALIGKIRNNLWLVIILLGLAMFGFIFMEYDNTNNVGGPTTSVGSIAGKKINQKDFERIAQARNNPQANYYAQRNQIWNSIIDNTIIDEQAENLGINVEEDELENLIYGPNYSPIVRQEFFDQQNPTGINTEQLNQIRDAEKSNGLNPEFANRWWDFKNRVTADRKLSKIGSLVSKSIYTPTWMVNMQGTKGNSTAQVEYVKVPFNTITNAEVTLEDADYQNYINLNKASLNNENETQILEYVTFNVEPTSKDSVDIRDELSKLTDRFKTESDVETFVGKNDGIYNEAYFLKKELPTLGADALFNAEIGDVYGPFQDDITYKLAKVLDKKVIPDSVSFRHILISIPNQQDHLAMQAAKDTIELVKGMIERKEFTFDSMALRFSTDPNTKAKGGDMGTWQPADPSGLTNRPSTLLKEVNDLIFYEAKEKTLNVLEMPYGVHLIEVTRQYKSGNQGLQVAYIKRDIKPSDKTQKAMFTNARNFCTNNNTIDKFRAGAKELGLDIETSEPLDKNSYAIGSLETNQDTRDLVRWSSNDANVGDVCPKVRRYSDKIRYYENKYVVAALSEKIPAGTPTVSSAKNSLKNAVMTYKKGEMLAAKLKDQSSLSTIASQYEEVAVDTIVANYNSRTPGALAQEPKVLGAIFNLENGNTSQPIVGNTGVYIVKVINKTEGAAPTNIPGERTTISNYYRNQVRNSLLPALKENIDVEDNRSSLF